MERGVGHPDPNQGWTSQPHHFSAREVRFHQILFFGVAHSQGSNGGKPQRARARSGSRLSTQTSGFIVTKSGSVVADRLVPVFVHEFTTDAVWKVRFRGTHALSGASRSREVTAFASLRA